MAVSTNAAGVAKFGIDPVNMFGFWDWVGGRYSMDSAIGLSTMLAIGPQGFRDMLSGFHAMDEHFRTTPFARNLPVIMALLAVWYTDFFGAQTVAVLPYEQYLKRFPAYLQQLTMESNGKHVTLTGDKVGYATAPFYWGEPGTNGQHSFYQLIHQGTPLIPCDFIAFAHTQCAGRTPRPADGQRLCANRSARVRQDAGAGGGRRHGAMAGAASRVRRQPTQPTILADELTPAILGSLVALYEHSVFVQGVIWDINSFDQWGVELGKALAQRIVPELTSTSSGELAHDSSTNALIARYRRQRRNA